LCPLRSSQISGVYSLQQRKLSRCLCAFSCATSVVHWSSGSSACKISRILRIFGADPSHVLHLDYLSGGVRLVILKTVRVALVISSYKSFSSYWWFALNKYRYKHVYIPSLSNLVQSNKHTSFSAYARRTWIKKAALFRTSCTATTLSWAWYAGLFIMVATSVSPNPSAFPVYFWVQNFATWLMACKL
jgi:hypothetical protein